MADDRTTDRKKASEGVEGGKIVARRIAFPTLDEAIRAGVQPRRRVDSLYLRHDVAREVEAVIAEHEHGAALRAEGINPRSRILIVAAGGNGKALLAEALATETGFAVHDLRQLVGYRTTSDEMASVWLTRLSTFPSLTLVRDVFGADGRGGPDLWPLVSEWLDDWCSPALFVCTTVDCDLARLNKHRFDLVLHLEGPRDEDFKKWLKSLSTSTGSDVSSLFTAACESLSGSTFSDLERMAAEARSASVIGKVSFLFALRELIRSFAV